MTRAPPRRSGHFSCKARFTVPLTGSTVLRRLYRTPTVYLGDAADGHLGNHAIGALDDDAILVLVAGDELLSRTDHLYLTVPRLHLR